MEKLIIRKAISKDKDRIFEIFESQDTKWDMPMFSHAFKINILKGEN